MTYEIITHEDLQKFRLQLLEDLTRIMSGTVQPQLAKEWLRSSEVRKILGISHGTLQNLRIKNILPHRKIGGHRALVECGHIRRRRRRWSTEYVAKHEDPAKNG